MYEKRGFGVLCNFSDWFGHRERTHIRVSLTRKVHFGRVRGDHLIGLLGVVVVNLPSQLNGNSQET